MTKDQITAWAREAGWIIRDDLHYMDHQAMQDALVERIERFAALVAAAERTEMAKHCAEITRAAVTKAVDEAIALEREACAKVCEDLESVSPEEDNPAPWHIAAAIRASGETTSKGQK